MAQTLAQLQRRAERWTLVEEALFEALGRWARSPGPPALRRALATWCHRHSWHAELWRDRRPIVDLADDRPEDELDERWPALADLLLATGIDDAVDVLVGSVLPLLEAAVVTQRAGVDARLDGTTARLLDLVAADLAAERAELEVVAP